MKIYFALGQLNRSIRENMFIFVDMPIKRSGLYGDSI